jgi:Kef-type K+ transport system membrane component KefB
MLTGGTGLGRGATVARRRDRLPDSDPNSVPPKAHAAAMLQSDVLPIEVPEFLRTELGYVLLLFTLFVVPRFFQRYRLPQAITSVALGAAIGLTTGWFRSDPTVNLLATLGIVSLFLFAGLEVDFPELKRNGRVLAQHVLLGLAALVGVAAVLALLLALPARTAVLLALAVLTPSTGFILDSLPGFGLAPDEQSWVKSKVIVTELIALGGLFVTLQSTNVERLAIAAGILLALVAILPVAFRWFASVVLPYAPKSEFAFLLMVAVVAALATRRLGVYYLLGAFIVGIVAQSFRRRLPAMASDQMLHAVEVFASVFVPFYFFHVGLQLRADDFSREALLSGLGLVVLLIPARILLVGAHRHLALREPWRRGLRVGLSMVPTLVFSLVIAEILRDGFGLAPWIFGSLVVYTLGNTLLPGLVLRPSTPAPQPAEATTDGASVVGVGVEEAPGR